MATFKGENSTISIKEEDQGWGKAPSSYAGAKLLQNKEGSFEAARNALESESRTPNSQLSGSRLGNTTVSATMSVEVDPENYTALFESLFYGQLSAIGSELALSAVTVSGATMFGLTLPVDTTGQTTLDIKEGDIVRLYNISDAGLQELQGAAVVESMSSTEIVLYHPSQDSGTLAGVSTDLSLAKVQTLRPAKVRKSFNVEETLTAEDGTTKARFMTRGAVVSSLALDLPQEGNIGASFSMVGSGKLASKQYSQFDSNLADGVAAHTSLVNHVTYDPLVLQDGSLIAGAENTRCIWLSGSVNIENGTETYFTGCSFDAQGSTSGAFRVSVSYEALFQDEDAYIRFNEENSSRLLLRIKDRSSDKCIVLYLPAFKTTSYTMKNATGLVTASIAGSALVDPLAVDSCIIGLFHDESVA